MDLTFSAEERAFEQEVREFIAANLTPEMKRAHRADAVGVFRSRYRHGLAARAAQQGLGRAGLAGRTWRAGLDARRSAGSSRRNAPAPACRNVNVMGVKMVGPVIIGFGTPEQKNYYLPRILSGEDYWCQGYSEPGSGSDLVVAEDPRGARRRRLHHQRHQDLDHARASRQPHVRAGAHQRYRARSRTASASS